jgi:hypothetical protein
MRRGDAMGTLTKYPVTVIYLTAAAVVSFMLWLAS